MEFKSFKPTENNCSAQNAVYEGCKTEDGVHLEYYMSSNNWDNGLSCFVESRDVIRSVDGDENLYREVCAFAKQLVPQVVERGLPHTTMLNVNFPKGTACT